MIDADRAELVRSPGAGDSGRRPGDHGVGGGAGADLLGADEPEAAGAFDQRHVVEPRAAGEDGGALPLEREFGGPVEHQLARRAGFRDHVDLAGMGEDLRVAQVMTSTITGCGVPNRPSAPSSATEMRPRPVA